MLGLGDDFYEGDGALPGHAGHLMATGHGDRAAQDEIDRIAGYALGTGQNTGIITSIPGEKSSVQRAIERDQDDPNP